MNGYTVFYCMLLAVAAIIVGALISLTGDAMAANAARFSGVL